VGASQDTGSIALDKSSYDRSVPQFVVEFGARPTLGSSLVQVSDTACYISLVDTTSLEFGRAVAEIGTLHTAEEDTAFLNFMGNIMTRIADDSSGEEGQT
jgi:hypothetical protein